jgi:hypothetical protein
MPKRRRCWTVIDARGAVEGPSAGPSTAFRGVFAVEGPSAGPSTALWGDEEIRKGRMGCGWRLKADIEGRTGTMRKKDVIFAAT